MTLPDPTLLCREAEDWAAHCARAFAEHDDLMEGRPADLGPIALALTADQARSLASLLSQLATLARAAGART